MLKLKMKFISSYVCVCIHFFAFILFLFFRAFFPFTKFSIGFVPSPLAVGTAVKITDFKVPNSFVIYKDDPLILDCAYEIDPKEDVEGVTVKWSFNGTLIYQWLPAHGKPPHTFVSIQLHSQMI